MTTRCYKLRGIDPLLFRDGRPFSADPAESSAQTLSLPLPGTLAGFLRTQLGNRVGWDWKADGPAKALSTEVHAPLLVRNGQIVYRTPADAILCSPEDDSGGVQLLTRRIVCLRPAKQMEAGEGCDLPEGMLPLRVTANVKPEPGYRYWPNSAMESWLSAPNPRGSTTHGQMGEPPIDEREHVSIDPNSGKAEDGKLFATRMLGFEMHPNPYRAGGLSASAACWSLLARVTSTEDVDLTGPGLLGGERRIGVIEWGNGIGVARVPAGDKAGDNRR